MSVDEIVIEKPPPGHRHVIQVDEREVAVLIFEAMTATRRPKGMSTDDALSYMAQLAPGMSEACKLASNRVLNYLGDRFMEVGSEPIQ